MYENKLKKIVREGTISVVQPGETERITDKDELNRLYALKVREELAEIIASDHKDIMEFVDLIEVAYAFAFANGFKARELMHATSEKFKLKGNFLNLALINLNPENPSNAIYFQTQNTENGNG